VQICVYEQSCQKGGELIIVCPSFLGVIFNRGK